MYVLVFVVGDDSHEAEGMRNATPEYCIPSMWRTLLTLQLACSGTNAFTDKKIAVKRMQHLYQGFFGILADRAKKQFIQWLGACQMWS